MCVCVCVCRGTLRYGLVSWCVCILGAQHPWKDLGAKFLKAQGSIGSAEDMKNVTVDG